MKWFILCIIGLLLSGCETTKIRSSQELKAIATLHQIEWDIQNNRPLYIKGKNGVTLRPCDASNIQHQKLFIQLYTQPESMKGYLDGKPQSVNETLVVLNNQSHRWDTGIFLSGFIGYTADNIPFMHGGIGVFPVQHMAELFLIELPEFRNQGLGKNAMVAFNHWAMFLQHINYGSEIRTLIARVSPNNIPAIKLLLAAGFKSTFDSNEFKDELNEPKPSYVRFIQSMVNIEGKNYNVTIMTTPRRPDPKVIFLKRIPNLIKTIQSSAS